MTISAAPSIPTPFAIVISDITILPTQPTRTLPDLCRPSAQIYDRDKKRLKRNYQSREADSLLLASSLDSLSHSYTFLTEYVCFGSFPDAEYTLTEFLLLAYSVEKLQISESLIFC